MTRKDFERMSNAELHQARMDAWTCGAEDDAARRAECKPILTPEHRESVIEFLLDLEEQSL
jgi:hypothetical protein